jgi:tripartite-type tricarboxylate transporter receptor subunit TctC
VINRHLIERFLIQEVRTMKLIKILSAFGIGMGVVMGASAEAYPGKPVRVIVPFTAGSATDIVARTVAQKLSELWGQTVVVDNRTGAGGTVGTGLAAKSQPNGYTLLLHSAAYAASPAVYSKLPYDTLKDFVEISALVSQPYVLTVGSSAGMKTVSGLIAAAKAKPLQINFGSAGSGSGTHLVAEKFRLSAGIEVVHVPYKGGPEATLDTITGRVTYWFPPVSLALPYIRDGKLLALGVSSAKRATLLPDVPTIAEAGVGGFEDSIWWGIWAPAGIPVAVVSSVERDIGRAIAAADVRDRLTRLGAEPMGMTRAEFTRFVRSEIESAARVTKAAGIKPQ